MSASRWAQKTPEQKAREAALRRARLERRRAAEGLAAPRVSNPDDLTPRMRPLGRWVAEAACSAEDIQPHWFDNPTDRKEWTPLEVLLWEQQQAAAACAGCPVRAECLDEARRSRFVGVWGGVLRKHNHRIPGGFSEHDLIATHQRQMDAERKAA